MAVDGSVVQKYSRKIGFIIHLFQKQNVMEIGKLISLGNLMDREITCLVSPTMSAHLILSCAK